ncbi:MAG: FRG domain-containing protein [Bacteroidales bacterium]|nr:FRG domain-containing protein [Bacteroidales bacterium]
MGKVKEIDDYVKIIESIIDEWASGSSSSNLWYRGHSNTNWQLIPKLYRQNNLYLFEREMIRDFKLRSSEYIEIAPVNDFDYLFVMQHYGLPTRLLDWTESYLVALFFAVFECELESDACVWVLDPWYLNEKSICQSSIVTTDHPIMYDYLLCQNTEFIDRNVKANLPIAIRPKKNTSRIISQKGMFVIYGNSKISIDSYLLNEKNSRIKCIVIDKDFKQNILKSLFFAGISYSSLFPELSGLCQEINYRYSDQFIDYNTIKINEEFNIVDNQFISRSRKSK